jgi:hypothetical protein
MKGKLVAFVAILCIASLIASGANAKGKPVKPDKPGNTQTELITFTGDLNGWQEVEGCCPNAGPFPQYKMTLSFAVGGFEVDTPIDGQLFMNVYRSGHDRGYKVQFWNDHDADNHVAIEIRGGKAYGDKKTKALTVVFENAECRNLHDPKDLITYVNFTLVRTPN